MHVIFYYVIFISFLNIILNTPLFYYVISYHCSVGTSSSVYIYIYMLTLPPIISTMPAIIVIDSGFLVNIVFLFSETLSVLVCSTLDLFYVFTEKSGLIIHMSNYITEVHNICYSGSGIEKVLYLFTASSFCCGNVF